jgi:hypothetical protein
VWELLNIQSLLQKSKSKIKTKILKQLGVNYPQNTNLGKNCQLLYEKEKML